MTRMGRGAGLLPFVATLAVAAALTGAAVVTVSKAGCEDPGRYVYTGHGVELRGGCLARGDLLVPSPRPAPPEQQPLNGAPLRG